MVFLWGCGILVSYYHSGHLRDPDRLAQVMDSYLHTSRPVIISREHYCCMPFYHTAQRLLVVDFPNSIDHYRDYKTLIDFSSHKGLVTALVSQKESHLLPKLKDYILQKGEHPPPWLVQEPDVPKDSKLLEVIPPLGMICLRVMLSTSHHVLQCPMNLIRGILL